MKLAGLILIPLVMLAQQQAPTVFRKIVENAVGDGAYHYVSGIPNIGQSTHQIYAKVETCAPGGRLGGLTMYGNSADSKFGSTSNQIPITLSSTFADLTTGIANVTGSGVYPILTIGYFAVGGCTISVYYSGTVNGAGVGLQKVVVTDATTGSNVLQVQGTTNMGSVVTGSDKRPFWLAGTGSSITGSKLVPIIACDLMATVSVTAGSTVAISTASSGLASSRTRICNFILTGSAANTTAQFFSGTQTTTPCDTGTVNSGGPFTVGTSIFSMGSGLGSVIVGEATKALCLTATVGTVTGTVMYAYDIQY